MHALPAPGLRLGLHGGRAAQDGEGPVVYDSEKCIGCRYCQYACPFGVPTYQWDNVLGLIRKCEMCFSRIGDGVLPACVAACPNGALRFGKRHELLAQAKAQIASRPGHYVDHIYGEHEAGGTSMLYLSDVPFSLLGFPTLGDATDFRLRRNGDAVDAGCRRYGCHAGDGAAPDHAPPAAGGGVRPARDAAQQRAQPEAAGHKKERRGMSTKGLAWQGKRQAGITQPRRKHPCRDPAVKDWLIGVLGFLAVMGVTAGVGRLFMGLQASTALSDDVSWGIWIGFDFGLIAFAGVGFTMAAVVHVFHLEQFHKALRPALLAGVDGLCGRAGPAGARPGPLGPLLSLHALLQHALAAL